LNILEVVMDGKKIKIITIVSLSLVAFSAIFTQVIRTWGIFSKAFVGYDNATDELIAPITCAAAIIAVIVTFAVFVKALNVLVGVLSCRAKRSKTSIVTASIFACIITALSAFVGVYVFVLFVLFAGVDGYAVLVGCALLLMPLTDLFWFGVAIYRAVKLSKALKLSIG
jgi:hypothetical protein